MVLDHVICSLIRDVLNSIDNEFRHFKVTKTFLKFQRVISNIFQRLVVLSNFTGNTGLEMPEEVEVDTS